MARFAGRRALIAGGSRGIGATIARRLAGEGAKVAIGYRSATAEAQELADAIAAQGGEAVILQGDVGRDGQAVALVEQAAHHWGGLDFLVNAAGIGPYRPLAMIDEAYIREMFDTNLLGAAMLTKAAVSVMQAGGRIVHFSSRLAFSPIPTSVIYAASKAAVMAMVHGYAKELGPSGITINAIAPGVIETDMTTQIIAERGDQIRAMTPLGRIGQPDDIAGIALFLLSEDARWITGRTLLADGGFT